MEPKKTPSSFEEDRVHDMVNNNIYLTITIQMLPDNE